jgi:FlaA1/EpsC-like NDP-sugar epimerase
MIRLSGKVPYTDIQIEYTGLRPGERLHETLFYSDEQLAKTDHQYIKLALPYQIDEEKLFAICSQLEDACNTYNQTALHNLLQEIVKSEISYKKSIKEYINE